MADFTAYSKSCATTARILKKEKRLAWKKFCTNLSPYTIIRHLWHTARLFKKCVAPSSRPINDDWFDIFCSKVAPCHVPSEDEANQQIVTHPLQPHVLLNPFSLPELIYAISSHRSSASGLDNISPLMLKHLPPNALDVLLRILNYILSTNFFPHPGLLSGLFLYLKLTPLLLFVLLCSPATFESEYDMIFESRLTNFFVAKGISNEVAMDWRPAT
ncbi:hypothetical protein QTP88_022425 [Uroleucon formosanum]